MAKRFTYVEEVNRRIRADYDKKAPAEVLAAIKLEKPNGPQMVAEWLASFTPEEQAAIEYDWNNFWCRPKQRAPEGDWKRWLICAGRGYG